MASLKEINGRIASVRSTLKITSAMKMVASAKLHKAQQAIGNMLPYERQLIRILSDLLDRQAALEQAGKAAPAAHGSSLLSQERPVRRVAIVAISSNASLCGAFNSSIIRETRNVIREYLDAGVSREDITVFSIGRKMADAMRRDGYPAPADGTAMADQPTYAAASALSDTLLEGFLEGRFDRVDLVYNHFQSTASQPCTRQRYLPTGADLHPSGAAGRGAAAVRDDMPKTRNPEDYIIEPDPAALAAELQPKVLRLGIYTTLLDSNAAEHAARTVAMQMATDNGERLLQELTLEYNKGRQQKITNEILDIVGGSLA